jgi:protein gp37
MALRQPWRDWYWDGTWNTVFGCQFVSPGCLNCYAARCAATLQVGAEAEFYIGTAELKNGRYVWTGRRAILPPGHPAWTWPLRWPGAERPLLGEGMPSLLWVGSMADVFDPAWPTAVIDRTLGTLALSDHLGLVLTRHPGRMVEYLSAANRLERWGRKFLVGFSAENQRCFDARWALMRPLAEAGWTTFVSLGPMLGPVTLPADFRTLAKWVIVSGEQGKGILCRDLDPAWARAVRDECAESGTPVWLKQLARKEPIPPYLWLRQLPLLSGVAFAATS